MTKLKKAIAGLAIAGVMAVSGMVVSSAPAHAQILGSNYNPISQWIVLSGLFNNDGGVGGGIGSDPISQWIVLSGLFGY